MIRRIYRGIIKLLLTYRLERGERGNNMGFNFKNFAKQGEHLELGDRMQIKTDDIMEKELTITGYSLFKGKHGDTAIVIVKEYPKGFLFAPSVLTDMLKQVDANTEAREALKTEGMQIMLHNRENKDGSRHYKAVEIL